MARADDLVPLLTSPRGSELSVTQGFLTAWDDSTFENEVEVNGATLTDVPLVASTEPNLLEAGAVVSLLRVRQSYYILRRVVVPGGSYSGTYTKAEVDSLLAQKVSSVDLPELVRDIVGLLLVEGTGIAIDVSDAGDTITIRNTRPAPL